VLAQRNLFIVERQVLQLQTKLVVAPVGRCRALGGGCDLAADILASVGR
jgi:outer membrane protein TolC